MEPAVLAAILGVGGVLLGAVSTGAITACMEWRRERAQARVAAGFIARELKNTIRVLQVALKNERWWPPGSAPRFSEWATHGAALLTGSGIRGTRFHRAVRHVEALAPLAVEAHERVDVATERIKALDERTANSGARSEAESELDDARAAVKLTPNDCSLIQHALDAVKNAHHQAHRGFPVWARRLTAGAVVTVAAAAGILAWALLQETTDTGEELAAGLVEQRDATIASCDKVDKVDHAWDCRLTYVGDRAGCRAGLERVADRAADGLIGVAVARAAESLNKDETQECTTRATAKIRAYEAENRKFLADLADLTLTESNENLRQRMRKRLPDHFSGWIPERCAGVSRALALLGRC